MPYISIEDYSIDSYKRLYAQTQCINKTNIINAINNRRFDELTIEKEIQNIQNSTSLLRQEYIKLSTYCNSFLYAYATNDNACYSSAKEMLNHMKYSMKRIMVICRKNQPIRLSKSQQQYLACYGKGIPSPISMSTCYTTTTQMRLFEPEEEGYPESVYRLIREMYDFNNEFTKNLNLVIDTLEKENSIREDKKYCNELLIRQTEEIRRLVIRILKGITITSISTDVKNNEFVKFSKDIYDPKKSCEHYHKHPYDDLFESIKYEEEKKILSVKMTDLEKKAYGVNTERIEHIRYVIEHFDELLSQKEGTKIQAKKVAMFLKWANACDIKNAHQHFFNTYKSNKYKPVGYSAVESQFKIIDESSIEFKTFANEISEITPSLFKKNKFLYAG